MKDFSPNTAQVDDSTDIRDDPDIEHDLLGSEATDPNAPQTVLVVDDSRLQRKLLTTSLKKWGYDVVEAASGQEGLELVKTHNIQMVISDWIMPEMNGPEFCREFRKIDRRDYGYFVLLTSKSESQEITEGLNSGADDFLTKPVSFGELKARLRAGERIVRMQSLLLEKNRVVNRALEEIRSLYESLDRDLEQAKKLQQSLVRETHVSFGRGCASLLLRPSGHVGGDLVGQFSINKDTIGVFSLDVSGHGVTSALLTARLAGHLSGRNPAQNVSIVESEGGQLVARDPAETAAILNELLLKEFDTDHYFTMALAVFDLAKGTGTMVQAGHPNPYMMRPGKPIEQLGQGGLPIGLISGAAYESFEFEMSPGDRLILHSDGIIESATVDGDMLDDAGFTAFLEKYKSSPGPELLDAIPPMLEEFSKRESFEDDVSALVFDYVGKG
ncbi:MAG: SpoIIE family protein phosphatase [Pseudomonadota bacterium]